MAWVWCTHAQVITKRPCKIHGVMVTPSAAIAEVFLYDGESDKDPEIFSLYTSVRVSWPHCFAKPLETHRGLYVGKFTGITGVLINWDTLGEGKG